MVAINGVQNTHGINAFAQGKEENGKRMNGDFALFLMEENAGKDSVAEQVKKDSRETIAAHNAALLQGNEVPDPKSEFMDFVDKSSDEQIRAQILAALGITEEDLEAMSPEDRMKMEMKIAEILKEKIRQQTEEQMASAQISETATSVMDAGTAKNTNKELEA